MPVMPCKRTLDSMRRCPYAEELRRLYRCEIIREDGVQNWDTTMRPWLIMFGTGLACILTSIVLLCTPVSACATQLDPLPCEPAGLRQTDGQFISAPRFRPVPSPRARARSNRKWLAR
jgi:hypothetical protein